MAWVPNLKPFDWQRGQSPYFDNETFDNIWPWLQEKGVRLTKIHAIHRNEAAEESAKLVEQSRQEKETAKKAAEAKQVELAAKPPGTQFSIETGDFPNLGQTSATQERACKAPPRGRDLVLYSYGPSSS
eukprot:4292206-Pyramimonas_sp.AAC.1